MQQQANISNSKQHWKLVFSDFGLVTLALCLAFTASSYFNVSDRFYQWAMQYEESWDIDELPLVLLVYLAGLLWFANRRMNESRRLIKQNHALLQRVLTVQETERKRLAQDLHDELGQYLNAIKVQATSLLVESKVSAETAKTSHLIVKTAEHGYQSARHMMQSLRPVALDECGLSAAIEHLIETWRHTQQQSPTRLQTSYGLAIRQDIDQFDETLNIAVFRIVQEALNNIAKHADANHVEIALSIHKGNLMIQCQDNGIGFNTEETTPGYGLIGIRERADALHGQLTITSATNEGTTILVSIPVANHRILTNASAVNL